MTAPLKTRMWAIVGSHGKRPFLYTGTWLLRVEAIAAHVHDVRRLDEPVVNRWPDYGPTLRLSPGQKQIWRRCQKVGDRAVKVTVTWDDDE